MTKPGAREAEAQAILRKIIADFERLGREIDRAIVALSAGNDPAGDFESLLRAKEAARKGAELAAAKLNSD